MDTPYLLSWAQIAELTDRQIVEVYYRPRDKEGNPLPLPEEHDRAELTEAQQLERERLQFMAMGTMVGISQERLVEAWDKRMEARNGGQR